MDMKKNVLYIAISIAFLFGGFSSCVEDEGSYEMSEINKVKISGIEENYNLISFQETLNVTPKIECTQQGVSEDDLEYKWFVCSNALSETDHKHEVIGTERNLSYKVDVAPGSYLIYFQVKDKHTGIKFEQYFGLNAISSFVRGFYLYGDKADGTVGMDFVSMPVGRDTIMIKDIFINSQKIKGAKDLIFTGHYDESSALWAITNDSQYKIEYSAQLEKVDIIPDENLDNLIYPTMETVQRPFHLTNVSPGTFGSSCVSLSRSTRLIVTENEVFVSSIIMSEAYGNPINRDSSSPTASLFKPYPHVFYSAAASNVSYVCFFDMTNHCFKIPEGSSLLSGASYCAKIDNDSETPFYLDQNKYNPVRQMVYAENGFDNAGRSYALMNDADGNYYVYGFISPARYGSALTKHFAKQIDLNAATDFEKASHYAFFSAQSVILYSVGNILYAYDYERKDCKLIKDYGAEVTYLAMEHHSTQTSTDFIVATYSDEAKGVVSKYTIADDVNNINVTLHEKEVWNTDLKVVKIVWKYSIF